ncbi:hypothetical protein [Streptomyces sp. NPDC097640]|uniref:hypothetical protein n=1 Tax=Streptomyces sp. NPDC097640 TaxID=3157229 RepID=UPI003324DF86
MHLEERRRAQRKPTGWSDNATTETPTGNIWMEREPEVAYYRVLVGLLERLAQVRTRGIRGEYGTLS